MVKSHNLMKLFESQMKSDDLMRFDDTYGKISQSDDI